MDVFKLSRDYFDWCFENPEKISPTHTAMYFFIIEHCNRLGWKKKFGLPMEMTKDAIGIKNYKTYANTFSDLIEFGFIELIQKSKNQYSSNIIAIVENTKALTKAPTKALDKAMLKHSEKQSKKQYQSIVGIDLQETNKQETRNNITGDDENWKNDFEIYLKGLRKAYGELMNDKEFIKKQEKYHPNVDIKLSIEKACMNYWATEAGWKFKIKKRTKDINWKLTLTNAIDINKVFKPRTFNQEVSTTVMPSKNIGGSNYSAPKRKSNEPDLMAIILKNAPKTPKEQ